MYACVYVCIGVTAHSTGGKAQPRCSLWLFAVEVHKSSVGEPREFPFLYAAQRSQGRTTVEIEGNAHLLKWSLAPRALLLIRNFVFVVSDYFALGDNKRIL